MLHHLSTVMGFKLSDVLVKYVLLLAFLVFIQCYKIVLGDDNKNWQDARKYCLNQGGNLVSILDEREQGEHFCCGCLQKYVNKSEL